MEVEALIEAVRKRQALYDKTKEGYSNRIMINELWDDVAQEIGIDGATARKKWAVLRDSFRRNLRKETAYKSGTGWKHKTWYLYKPMSFLLPFTDLNPFTTSDDVDELQESSQLLEDCFGTLPDVGTAPQAVSDTKPGPSNPALSMKAEHYNSRNSRKRPYPPYQQRQAPTDSASSLDAILDALKGLQQQQQIKDDDEHFLLSLLPVMKKLDPTTKFEFRGELNDLALKYIRLTQ